MEEAFKLYEDWGIAGVKIDFMDRDDQEMVGFYHQAARRAANHRLLVNFHGAYKPDGLRRTWPNIITREAVLGLEWNRLGTRCNPAHDLTLPFTRMLAGPMDYTPGAFRTVLRKDFQPRAREPLAQGTRSHQLAMYVVYESPPADAGGLSRRLSGTAGNRVPGQGPRLPGMRPGCWTAAWESSLPWPAGAGRSGTWAA